MHHGAVLQITGFFVIASGQGHPWQLVWKDHGETGTPDITVARAGESHLGDGRLFFKQHLHVRRASSNVLAFRRLLRRSSRSLPLLQPELRYDTSCVPRWPMNSAGTAFLLHVSKSGGTALREVLLKGPGAGRGAIRFAPHFPEGWQEQVNVTNFTVGRLQMSYHKRHALEHGTVGMVPGGQLAWELQFLPGRVLGLAMFRNPVQRFLSHFYYARQLDWTSRLHLRRLRPVQYLQHPVALLDTLMVWQDGMAGTAWLAGYSIHVGAGSTRRTADDQRLWALYKNRTRTLQKAVQSYHKLMFVGLLEDLDGSMRLLQTLLRWPKKPQIQKLNSGQSQIQRPEEMTQIQAALRVLAPMDLWLYQYISQDFNMRLKALEGDEDSCDQKGLRFTAQPEVQFPTEHELGGCTSSRERIACGAEVFEG